MADDLTLKISADASGVQKGVSQAASSLDTLSSDAAKTSKNLAKLGDQKVAPTVTVTVKDQAIAKAKADIARLRDEVARGLLVGADTSAAQKRIAELQRNVRALEDKPHNVKVSVQTTATGELSKLGTQLSGLGIGAVSVQTGLVGALGAASTAAVKTAADMETMRAQLDSVVKGGDNAKRVFDELKVFAAATPFEFPELLQATNTLASFGVQADQLVETVRGLGEAASAAQAPIQDVALVYGQMLARGKLSAEDVLQLQSRGIDVWGSLAKQLGVTVDQLKEMSEQGKIGRKEIEKLPAAFADVYSGSIARQAETFNGKMSTLSDLTKDIAAQFGNELNPQLKTFMDLVNDSNLPAATAEFAKWMGFLNQFSVLGTVGKIREMQKPTQVVAKTTKDAATETKGMVTQTRDLAKAYDDAKSSLDKLLGSLDVFDEKGVSRQEAQIAYQRAIDDATQSLKDNGRTLDINSEKGRQNREALTDVAKAIGDQTNARLHDARKSGESTASILSDYNRMRQSLIEQATRFTGSKRKAEEYVNTLLGTPEEVATEVKVTGVTEAEKQIDKLAREREVQLNLQVHISQRVQKELDRFGASDIAPRGGTAPRSMPPEESHVGPGLQIGPPTAPLAPAPRSVGPQQTVSGVMPQGTVGGVPVNFGVVAAQPQVIINVSDKRLSDLITVAVRDAVSGTLRVLNSRQVVQT